MILTAEYETGEIDLMVHRYLPGNYDGQVWYVQTTWGWLKSVGVLVVLKRRIYQLLKNWRVADGMHSVHIKSAGMDYRLLSH